MDWVSKSCDFAGCPITFHCTFAAHDSIVSLSSAVKRRKIFQYSVSISNCWSSRLMLCNKHCSWIFVFVANPIWYSNDVVVFCSLYISIPELNNSLDAFDYPYDLGLSHWVTGTGESHGYSCTNEIILRAACNTSWYLNKDATNNETRTEGIFTWSTAVYEMSANLIIRSMQKNTLLTEHYACWRGKTCNMKLSHLFVLNEMPWLMPNTGLSHGAHAFI